MITEKTVYEARGEQFSTRIAAERYCANEFDAMIRPEMRKAGVCFDSQETLIRWMVENRAKIVEFLNY